MDFKGFRHRRSGLPAGLRNADMSGLHTDFLLHLRVPRLFSSPIENLELSSPFHLLPRIWKICASLIGPPSLRNNQKFCYLCSADRLQKPGRGQSGRVCKTFWKAFTKDATSWQLETWKISNQSQECGTVDAFCGYDYSIVNWCVNIEPRHYSYSCVGFCECSFDSDGQFQGLNS